MAEPTTIKMTPTWSGLLPMMLAAWSAKESTEMKTEFTSMARAADGYNKLAAACREGDPQAIADVIDQVRGAA